MKKKIVLLPLDERPCNYDFPMELFNHEELEIVRPDKLGDKKKLANRDKIINFLKKECIDADGLILSIDMLLYGGLVPSRIHNGTVKEFRKMSTVIKELKEKNPNLLIYGFQVVMRCPSYSSNDEEPDYYEECGETIHRVGELIHKSRLGLSDEKKMNLIMPEINQEYLNDYVGRRQINCEMNRYILNYLKEGYLDFMVIPQDDSATYGYAAMDQEIIRAEIMKQNLGDRILVYPGADEVGMVMIARLINKIHGKKPKVYVKYVCEKAKYIVPLYEGNTLSTTVKYHILSSGCQVVECYEHADLIMVVTAPAGEMKEAIAQPCLLPDYRAERNFPELIDFIKDRIAEGKQITIADNAYANGGDLEFINMLNYNNLLLKVDGYAGWNTSANTIGTALAEGIDALYYGKSKAHQDFLVKRYIEDVGYCSVVRGKVTEELAGTEMNYFDVKEKRGFVSQTVEKYLREFLFQYCSSVADKIWLKDVYMPWRRMFEVGFQAGIEASSDDRSKGI